MSSCGRVRSLDGARGHKGRIVKPKPDRDGYLRVNCTGRGRRRRTERVHQLVAAAFVGPRPTPEHEVRHLDGRRDHNHAGNLLWGTVLENRHDRKQHGTNGSGESNGRAKLREEQVREIRASTESNIALARRYGVGKSTIGFARTHKTWREVTDITGR